MRQKDNDTGATGNVIHGVLILEIPAPLYGKVKCLFEWDSLTIMSKSDTDKWQ